MNSAAVIFLFFCTCYDSVSRHIGLVWPGIGYAQDGGRSSVDRQPEFKSKDLGFNPLAGQGEKQFFCPSESTLVQTCLCLTPLRVYSMHSHLLAR